LILTSFIVSVDKKEDKPFDWKWLTAALCGTLFSGFVGVAQKLFGIQTIEYSLDLFLCVSFVIIILLSGVMFFISHIFEKKEPDILTVEKCKVDLKTLGFTALLGIAMGGVNKLNTYLASILPSVVMFSTINGGVIVATACFSALLYKERLSKKQIVSIMIGFVAIAAIVAGQNI
jgi:drug/metabolite transporter (DMT)-like permease